MSDVLNIEDTGDTPFSSPEPSLTLNAPADSLFRTRLLLASPTPDEVEMESSSPRPKRRKSTRLTKCLNCNYTTVPRTCRSETCTDCVVRCLQDAKILVNRQGIFQSSEEGYRMCEYCHHLRVEQKRETSVCEDCIFIALQRINVLEVEREYVLRPVRILPLDFDSESTPDLHERVYTVDNHCSLCDRGIGDEREYLICMDCMFDSLVDEGIIEYYVKKHVYVVSR